MTDLRLRFGSLLAAHRRRLGLTQEDLADRAGISVDMVSKIETGASGARFPTIQRLAEALRIDPAELFSTEIPNGALARAPLVELTSRLALLSEGDVLWIAGVVDAALKSRR
jgi:transcriptional regulator with XRE-family HTH domain